MLTKGSIKRRQIIMIILSILTTLLSLTQASPTPKLCSCSPRAFLFKLNLSTGFCPQVYPASSIFGNGIKDYTCRISLSPNNSDDNDDVDLFDDPPRTTQEEEAVVNSIQFIEVDTNFNILHTSLVKDVTLYSGDTFRYTTLQNDDLIAGGLSIILRGTTAEGDDTENIFTVTYTNECGVRAFEGGERIGWVTIENLIPASSRSCDVVEEGDDVEFNVLSPSSSTGVPTVKPSGVMHGRTPDGILKEILQLLEEKDDSLFVDGFVFLIEQALTAYYDSLVFDAIYKTTDASKDLGCDETGGVASKGLICSLLSEALCGLAMEIGGASSIGAGVTSPTFFPSSGATSVVATGLTSPPTTVARPAA